MLKPVLSSRPNDKETKQLSDAVHLGLYSLAKVYKTTQEFDKCLQKGMFVKSNPAAFPHVMHFLFFNLDPGEFKARFLWPLHADKSVEKEFRQTSVKYINDLNKKYSLGMDDVGKFIVVVPGGVKFMKVLLGLIRLLQVETLKSHASFDWQSSTPEQVFDAELQRIKAEYAIVRRTHLQIKEDTQRQMTLLNKKAEILHFYTKALTKFVGASQEADESAVRQTVNEICVKMRQVVSVVSDLERTFGSSADQQNSPFEKIQLSNAITRIVQHHNWILGGGGEEYTHKIGCASVLGISSRILEHLHNSPAAIQVTDLELPSIVNQNHEIAQFLRNSATFQGDLNLIKNDLRVLQNMQLSDAMDRSKVMPLFPEREYPLIPVEDFDLGAFYMELQQKPNTTWPMNRLALEDAIPDSTMSPPPSKSSFSTTADHSLSSAWATARKQATAKKRTKAMSVLKTISRTSKKTKVNKDALRELARCGFNDSLLNGSNITWKRNGNISNNKMDNSYSAEGRQPSTLSGIFSESMMPKFLLNSTSIFNSTTNEQQANVFGDITNKDSLLFVPPDGKQVEMFACPIEEQENILDCSDSVLV